MELYRNHSTIDLSNQVLSIIKLSTRQKQNLVYFKPQIKKVIGREMLAHRGSNLWKEIKSFIKNLRWLSFKTQYKKILLNTTIRLESNP